MSTLLNRYWFVLAPLSGLLVPLAFAPYDAHWLIVIALASLYVLCSQQSLKKAALTGYLFGGSMFGFGVWYAYISIHDNGGADPISAILLTALLAGFMALFLGLAGLLLAWASRQSGIALRVLLAAFLWIFVEWLRGDWVLNGFPWLQIAYSQLDTPLAGFAPIVGVYGVGFILALSVFLTVETLRRRTIWPWSLLSIALLWGGGHFLDQHLSWTEASGEPIRITLLQGNISQTQKWQSDWRLATLKRYQQMSQQHWQDSDVIIWPETSIPAFYHQVAEPFVRPLAQEAASHQVDLVIGLPYTDGKKADYNSVLVPGETAHFYHKHHLLPFGEYLPLQPLSGWILDQLQIPLGDFARGDAQQPLLVAGGQPFVTTICYEDVFGDQVSAQAEQAAYLVNVTNDAWFGDSSQPYQHMQMAQMRALETGRYLVRATNTGLTGVVDPQGQLVAQLPLFVQDSLTASILPMQGLTPYMLLGDSSVFAGLIGLVLLVYGWSLWASRRA